MHSGGCNQNGNTNINTQQMTHCCFKANAHVAFSWAAGQLNSHLIPKTFVFTGTLRQKQKKKLFFKIIL